MLAALIGPALAGCRANTSQEIIEAQLRCCEREVANLRQELETARVTSEAFQEETRRRGLGLPPGDPSRPGLREISIAAGTGGIDDDRDGRDESFLLVLVPRDEGGNAVRAVGSATVTIYEIGPTGLKTLLDNWDVPASDLRRTWRSSLLSTGYSIPLAWRNTPMSQKLRVEARFVAADGTPFAAEKEVRVRPPLPPPAASQVLPTPAPGPPSVLVKPPPIFQGPKVEELPGPPRIEPTP